MRLFHTLWQVCCHIESFCLMLYSRGCFHDCVTHRWFLFCFNWTAHWRQNRLPIWELFSSGSTALTLLVLIVFVLSCSCTFTLGFTFTRFGSYRHLWVLVSCSIVHLTTSVECAYYKSLWIEASAEWLYCNDFFCRPSNVFLFQVSRASLTQRSEDPSITGTGSTSPLFTFRCNNYYASITLPT